MAKKKRKDGALMSRRVPVDTTAARVLGSGKKKADPQLLRRNAKNEKDPDRKRALLEQARSAESAQRRADKRLVSKKALAKAKRALQRAAWERDN